MNLVGPVADLLTLFQLFGNIRVAGSCEEGWEPVESGDEAVLDLAGRYSAWPAYDCRHAEATFHDRAFALRERCLSAVRPSEDLGAVVGCEHYDGVVVDAQVLQFFQHEPNVIVELRHSGLVNGPAMF